MHGALKAVIVSANSELQGGAVTTAEVVDPAISHTDGRMDVEVSGDFSANFDVASVPVDSEIPAEPTAFGNSNFKPL